MGAARSIHTAFLVIGGIAGAIGVVLLVLALVRSNKGLGIGGVIALAFGGVFVITTVSTSPSEPELQAAGSNEVSEGELAARQTRAAFTEVITQFHDDIVAGRIDAAYAGLAPMYRGRVTREQFAGIAQHPALAPGVTYDMRGSSVTRGLATVSGYLAGPSGPAKVDLRCTNIDGRWRISGLFVDGVSVLP